MKANKATWLTRLAPYRSTMRLFDQFAIAMQPAQMAKMAGEGKELASQMPDGAWQKHMAQMSPEQMEVARQAVALHKAQQQNAADAVPSDEDDEQEGEDEEETALREVKEEVCLTDIHLLPDFRDQVNYVYRRHGKQLNKTVVFFLGEVSDWSTIPDEPPSHEHKPHPKEGRWFVWVSEREAERRLFHPGMRKLLSRASLFLFEYDRIKRKYTQP